MLLILEGPDLAGKTTTAKAMQAFAAQAGYGTIIQHAKAPLTNNWREEYLKPLFAIRPEIASQRMLVILDRWHLGELWYGPELRGRSILDANGHVAMRDWLREAGATQLVLIADEQSLRDRYEARGDSLLTLDQVLRANDWYLKQACDDDLMVTTSAVSTAWLLDTVIARHGNDAARY